MTRAAAFRAQAVDCVYLVSFAKLSAQISIRTFINSFLLHYASAF